MRIFETHTQLAAALALPLDDAGAFRLSERYMPAAFQCCACGVVKLFERAGGTGYAIVDGNQLCCYDCTDRRQREDMRDQSKPFYAYLSSDGKQVTTWTGGFLGKVESLGSSRSGWHGASISRFHVQDVHGQWWQGRGAGRGMCCTLRKMKAPK